MPSAARHGQTSARLADALGALGRWSRKGDRRDGNTIELAPDAESLVRAVAARFDAYLPNSTRTHSPAI